MFVLSFLGKGVLPALQAQFVTCQVAQVFHQNLEDWDEEEKEKEEGKRKRRKRKTMGKNETEQKK